MLAAKAWKLESIVMMVGRLFICIAAGMMCLLAINWLWPDMPKERQQVLGFMVSALSLHGAAVVLLHLFLREHAISWGDFVGLHIPDIGAAVRTALAVGVLAVPLALSLNLVSAQLLSWCGNEPVEQPMVQVLQLPASLWQRLWTGFTAIVLAPVVEESLFRGIVYPAIKEMGYRKLALYGSSALFAAIHVNLMTFLPLMALAIILVQLYERTNTLLAPIVTHAFFNAVNFAILVRKLDLERWLRSLTN